MDFKTFWLGMTPLARAGFAKRCKSTAAHMSNVAYGGKTCGVKLAVQIERESKGKISRQQLRPYDYFDLWPELGPRGRLYRDKKKAA